MIFLNLRTVWQHMSSAVLIVLNHVVIFELILLFCLGKRSRHLLGLRSESRRWLRSVTSWFISWMNCHVSFQIYCWIGSIWALLASVWFIVRVSGHVSFQIHFVNGSIWALMTFEWFTSWMSFFVGFHKVCSIASIRAFLTFVWFFFWMCPNMKF